jgi:hypothetical protein
MDTCTGITGTRTATATGTAAATGTDAGSARGSRPRAL